MNYRGYTIEYRVKPVPTRKMDWEWTSDPFDIDSGHYSSCGFAESEKQAKEMVDAEILEREADIIAAIWG